jgi:hypothetical protein
VFIALAAVTVAACDSSTLDDPADDRVQLRVVGMVRAASGATQAPIPGASVSLQIILGFFAVTDKRVTADNTGRYQLEQRIQCVRGSLLYDETRNYYTLKASADGHHDAFATSNRTQPMCTDTIQTIDFFLFADGTASESRR